MGRRGIAAVEFAIIAPVLLVMFIGTVEVLTLYRTEGKLNALAFNVAEMVSVQASNIPTNTGGGSSLNDICQGAILGLQPFPPGGLTIAVASVTLERGPNGLPDPNTSSSFVYNATKAYDVWEADSTVSGHTCSTPGTGATTIGAANAILLATTNPPSISGTSGSSGEVEVPCDNVIIVQASITYPGLTGLIVKSRPTLTQTAYTRWRYASDTEQLLCPNCTLTPTTPLDLCNSNNSSATN